MKCIFLAPTEEVELLEQQLEMRENEIHQLREAHNRSQHEVHDTEHKNKEYSELMKETAGKVGELQRELHTKDDLVGYLSVLLVTFTNC